MACWIERALDPLHDLDIVLGSYRDAGTQIWLNEGNGQFTSGPPHEEILSREHEDIGLAQIGDAYTAFYREYRPAGTRPSDYAGLPFSARRFYASEFPALLRELRLADEVLRFKIVVRGEAA